ncbi:Nse4 C-terminal-domain-containing protein [Polychytrium aggregatum]|uniref:Nse4 C-terminal-domain-containing protein n=1 Tax=Polychytrium aggregatum TaxID=110093 RepID=UPI0022FEE70E|nr:Nse4 C-terminal-domain-containing protein [Polychytrium aggregatum]KAI9207766.1 Nse4 C-terminal-domain-containing protein [Polychytrium aggregatum]
MSQPNGSRHAAEAGSQIDSSGSHLIQINDRVFGNQSKDEARKLKRRYRDMLSQAEDPEYRHKLMDPSNKTLDEVMDGQSELFSQVQSTNEAVLDSKLLVMTTGFGLERVKKIRVDGAGFDINQLIRSIGTRLYGHFENDGQVQNDLTKGLKDMERITARHLAKAPTVGFMFGPLTIEEKVRAVPKRSAKLVKDQRDLVKPQELREQDIQRHDHGTTGMVSMIAAKLHECGRINVFRFIINPDSFSQSVENLFYLSFLIRDGRASIFDDEETGEPMLQTERPPTQENYDDGLTKKQLILQFDQDTWDTLKEVYDIRPPSILPTRESTVDAASTGKWYG